MPSRVLVPRIKAPVRWVRDSNEHPDDGHFELWCPQCPLEPNPGRSFWPITLEFWDPHNLNMCRACNKAARARYIKARRRAERNAS